MKITVFLITCLFFLKAFSLKITEAFKKKEGKKTHISDYYLDESHFKVFKKWPNSRRKIYPFHVQKKVYNELKEKDQFKKQK